MAQRIKLSAVVMTYNEERKIERCLRSITWADEIVVIDSYSTDRTIEICRRFTDNIYQHPWPRDYAQQRNIGNRHTTHDWVLSLDADEVMTENLRKEIFDLLSGNPDADSYGIPRLEYFAGKWITAGGWVPQYKFYLNRKSTGEWVSPIHERFVTRGEKGFLKNPILHDGMGTFETLLDKFNHYNSIEVAGELKSDPAKRFSLIKAILKPLERFFARFILKRGYKDGIHGFYIAAVIAINYFLKECKIYEFNYMERMKEESWDKLYRDTAVGGNADHR
jgi:glycosyltransferase involved in cell wall biosynthesis